MARDCPKRAKIAGAQAPTGEEEAADDEMSQNGPDDHYEPAAIMGGEVLYSHRGHGPHGASAAPVAIACGHPSSYQKSEDGYYYSDD